jgi:hypothetical protein
VSLFAPQKKQIYVKISPRLTQDQMVEMRQWCLANAKGHFSLYFTLGLVSFECEEDTTIFTLRWL